MKIKRVDGHMLSSIYQLGKQEFHGEFWFTEKFLRDTKKRNGICLGAFENNKLIGTIFVDLLDRPKAWIFFFIVDKTQRKKGIGSSLLKEAEKRLPKNLYEMYVDFEKTDKEAIRFYKKHGFKQAGKIKNWFGKGTYGLIYSKTVKK
jgi:ribosomal protein S18 acetylase RimI-like enzyme